MKKNILFLVLFFAGSNFFALPRFGLRLNDRCIDCHVNPTGGIVRNEDGWSFGKNVVSMISPRDKDISLSPKISDNISIGFDYRTQWLYSQQKKRSDFQDMSGSIYTAAKLSEKIDVVARYDFVASIWEAYGIARILPNNSYIKFGTFQPYFGIRLDDHTAYTRGGDFGLLFSSGIKQGLLFNPYYIETGIEAGINIADFIFLTSSVGKHKFSSTFSKDPSFTSRIELTPSYKEFNFLLGGSYASVHELNREKIYGFFGGVGYDRLSLLGEYDIAEDYTAQGIKSNALMLEASYQLFVGLDAVVRYDRFDPNTLIDDDEFAHLIVGVEFFPYSFIEVRPQYRFNLEEPKIDNDAFVLQFHIWY